VAHFHLQVVYLAQSLHQDEFPWWNPYVFAGLPHIADPQALILSPLHFLLAYFDPAPSLRATDTVTLAMLGLGGVGIILLFRDRGWHWGGAVIAALCFVYGGAAAWRFQHTGQLMSLSWWPLALWAMERSLARLSFRWGLLTGFFEAMMVMGRDQVGWLGFLLLLVILAWHWFAAERPARAFVQSLRPIAGGVIAGVSLVIVPFLMTVFLTAESNRPVIDFDEAGKGSLHPAALLTAFIANIFGVDGPLADYWGPPTSVWGDLQLYLARNMMAIYMGAIPLLGMLWLGVGRGAFAAREVRPFVIAFVLATLYALGRYTPAYTLFAHIPGADLFRRPADANFFIGALGAIIGGYAVSRLLDGTLEKSRRGDLVGAGLVLAGAGLCLFFAWQKQRLALATPAITIGLASLAISALALLLASRWRASRVGAVAVLMAVLTLDLSVNNGPNESTALPASLYEMVRPDTRNETVNLLKRIVQHGRGSDRRDRIEYIGLGFDWPNTTMVHQFDNTLGYNPIRLGLYSKATGAEDHAALPSQREFSPLMPSYDSLLANMLGLRFIVSGVPLTQVDPKATPDRFPLIARTADGLVYENPRALPRVFLATEAKAADFDQLLNDGRWPDFDPRKTVLLDKEHADKVAPGTTGTASIRRYRTSRVVIDVTTQSGGVLVLNDVWHPWWSVTVDGQPAELLRANVLFRGVYVPAGMHRVRFIFTPLTGLWTDIQAKFARR
jgi:hypothetical protein